MLEQMILPGFENVISSRALESGLLYYAKQTGRMNGQFGPVPAPVSLFPAQESKEDLQTSGTCGQLGIASSASADLQQSLANKLQARLAGHGGTLYQLIWKTQVTPAGRPICALVASVRRIPGNASTGWPTPASTDGKGGYQGGRTRNGKLSTDRLDVTAQLAGWPTPTASNGNGPRPNPLERDFPNLQTAAQLADTGVIPDGSGAKTSKSDQLNPELSLWLMGLPDEVLCCGVSAIRLSPRLGRRLLKQ